MLTENQMIEIIRNVFVNKQLEYEYDEECKTFSKKIEIKSYYSYITTNICVMGNGIDIFATSDLEFKKNIKAAAEYVARINYAYNRCSFALDCDSGTHRYGMFIPASEIEAHAEDIDDYITALLAHCTILYNTIGLGMLMVMFKAETPKKAASTIMEKIDNLCSDNDDDKNDGGNDNHGKIEIPAD